MNVEEFITLVREMRDAQKEYFKTRNKIILAKSKDLERKVDKMLSQFQPGMLDLFS